MLKEDFIKSNWIKSFQFEFRKNLNFTTYANSNRRT